MDDPICLLRLNNLTESIEIITKTSKYLLYGLFSFFTLICECEGG